MSKPSDFQIAETLTGRRAWAAIIMGVLFALSQLISLGDPFTGVATVVYFGAWIVWGGILVLFLVWSAGMWRRERLRGLVNDETTVENRRRAAGTGFWSALLVAFLVYAMTFYEPVAARDACRLIATAALAPALIRFGWLELKALRSE